MIAIFVSVRYIRSIQEWEVTLRWTKMMTKVIKDDIKNKKGKI